VTATFSGISIRLAREEELAPLPALEVAAGARFREVGMDAVADDAPPSLETFAEGQRTQNLLVAVDRAEVVIGFVLLHPLDSALHVEQITVAPALGRRGIGARLMAAAEELARRRGFAAMTLTTFSDVAFNGPFYASLGWRSLADGDLTPGLARIRADERAAGLDRWPRQAMAKAL
jgi:GNAT superfamily N-acetyltransferase